MKLRVFLPLALFISSLLHAQVNEISYNDFLQQAISFKNRPNVQEVWVVHFWASWNSPSMENVAPMKQMFTQYRNKPVRFVSISVDKLRANWERALRQLQMPWEQMLIPREDDYTFLKKAFRHNALPALFVVDQQGIVRRMQTTLDLQNFLSSATQVLPNTPYYGSVPSGVPPSSQPATTPSTTQPVTQPQVDPQPPVSTSGSEEWVMHTVQPGETLFRLYKTYGVPVEQIKSLNGLTSNNINVGQKLKIKRK